MGLNIKNEETCALARELADLTGETVTGAINVALRERLEREKRERDRDALLRDVRAIAERCAARLGPGPSSTEIGDFLYDGHGLPKRSEPGEAVAARALRRHLNGGRVEANIWFLPWGS